MTRKIIALLLIAVVAATGGYFGGYHRAQEAAATQTFDRLLSDLSNNILIRDALESREGEQVKPLLTAAIEADFARMIYLQEHHGFTDLRDLRCGISRRFRQLRQDGRVLADENKARDEGLPIELINSYLKSECLGSPSHRSWIPMVPMTPSKGSTHSGEFSVGGLRRNAAIATLNGLHAQKLLREGRSDEGQASDR